MSCFIQGCERTQRIINVIGLYLPEHKEWADKNFPDSTEIISAAGMVEECGELFHALIKNQQGIRGTEEKHLEDMKDAIGDISIYLLDFLNRTKVDEKELLLAIQSGIQPEYQSRDTDPFYLAGNILESINTINQSIWNSAVVGYLPVYHAVEVLSDCDRFCQVMGWDYPQIIQETWKEVQKRDWTKNKISGKAE